ncbi:MAG: transcriptional regulator [Treponema sp.]|nr:transcriptional regulator [Treponema sp.]
MTQYKLLICIVPHDKGELVTGAAVAAGSFGGTVLMGRGMASNSVIAALGLGESSKDIVYILTEESQRKKIADAIVQAAADEKANFGSMLTIDAAGMVKNGIVTGEEHPMPTNEQKPRELITVILNKGYADDAMAAARKAGAGGGTVINARGTAREDDAKFFGMHIVPEKEMLVIVVEHEKKDAVLESIRTLPCLAEPGSGIAFCTGVDEFTLLGKTN